MDIVDRLVELLVILVAAKVGAEVMARFRQPPVIGELVMGMIVGASVLGWVDVGDEGGVVATLVEIGIILLLFDVGLEIQLRDMVRLGRTAATVALIGVATPFALGYGASLALGIGGGSVEAAIFVGAAMTATSVGITARVFSDLRATDSDEARVVIGAAVVDDVIGLIILAVVAGVLGTDAGFRAGELASLGVRVLLFLGVAVAAGSLVMPHVLRLLAALRVPGSYIVGAIVIAISLGVAAEELAGLDPIVGAFVAGLIVGSADHVARIQGELAPIAYLLVPIFFLAVGAQVDVPLLLEPSVLGAGLVVAGLAVVGKVVSGLGAAGTSIRKLVVGVGMVPRGEVGLIFAAFGATQLAGTVGAEEVAIVVLAVIVTTLAAPLALGRLLQRSD